MTSQHLPSAASRDVVSASHRRLVPARIVREADCPRDFVFDVHVIDGPMDPTGPDVGIIDTGVVVGGSGLHDFLRNRVTFHDTDIDEVTRADPGNSYGHGTFVAGVIGVESRSSRLQMKGVIDRESGKWEDEAVANAIREFSTDVQLINLSFSGDADEDLAPEVIVRALEGLGAERVVVAAAGNGGPDATPAFPAAIDLRGPQDPLIVSVGAVEFGAPGETPTIAEFSAQGDWVRVYANGRHISGPYRSAGWAKWTGTSFACAIVTGRIAAAMANNAALTARAAAEQVIADAAGTVMDQFGNERPYLGFKETTSPVQG